MNEHFIIGTYSLKNEVLELIQEKFTTENTRVIDYPNLTDIINIDPNDIPDVLLVDTALTGSKYITILKRIAEEKNILIAELGEDNKRFSYYFQYNNSDSIEITNNVLAIMADTLRKKKLAKNGFNRIHLIKYEKNDSFTIIRRVLSFIETKDNYTKSHCERVAEYATLLAIELDFSQEDIQKIYCAGLIHDIGKIGIPDSILTKSGKLTNVEFDLMKKHAGLSENLLYGDFFNDIRGIIRSHHERYDGTGYPDGLKGNNIPLEARIITVADAVDAMITNRSYSVAKSIEETLDELVRCSGTQFDPELALLFVELFKNNSFLNNKEEKHKHNF